MIPFKPVLFLVVAAHAASFVVDPPRHRRNSSSLFAKRVPRPAGTSTTGPKGPRSTRASAARTRTRQPIKRAPHQFDHTKEEARPFVNVLAEIQSQDSNEKAPLYQIKNESTVDGKVIAHEHFETYSLDDVFPGLDFSHKFASSSDFRTDLRNSMRKDIFDTTPTYHGMSEKARTVLLLPDSSLQGSWKCNKGGWSRANHSDKSEQRMQRLTKVLRQYLGDSAPTGDAFMDSIGGLCGSAPSTHWIDIVGVLNRRIPHSWHQDTGNSPQDSKTVLLGFPPKDNYSGVGVFSHILKLEREQWAPKGHPPAEPVLYREEIDDEYIVRPRFAEGSEIIVYRDVDDCTLLLMLHIEQAL